MCRAALSLLLFLPAAAHAGTSIRIAPVDGATIAEAQQFDIRVEATGTTGGSAPRGLRVAIDGVDVTSRNLLDPGVGGERGAGGTGASPAGPARGAAAAPPHTTNFLLRDYVFSRPGRHTITAGTADGATASATVIVDAWQRPRPGGRPARNIILLVGDGMGAAHRTAARIVSRGVAGGRARAPLAMDTLEVSGQVTTFALNSVITDSAPGMSSYVTGQKGNNNQAGVYPDNTADPFDNPRVEYIGAMLRRLRGSGFNVGIVTTADVTDATPAANAVHTADRDASSGIADRFFDERARNGVTVLLGGGARHFAPRGAPGSTRQDARDLAGDFQAAGYTRVSTGAEVRGLLQRPEAPARLLGLFHPRHLNVAFDKVGAGRYSQELAGSRNTAIRDQPMLDGLARLALASLERHSPAGFYLMIEGASIDKQAHAVDPERTIWDAIELDNAVRVALDFAARTNADRDPSNDTLVIVTADHECGGLGIVGVGNEHYAPARLGRAVRDYAAVFRFEREQVLDFTPEYEVDADGYPVHPDPPRKLLLGWAAGPDHHQNWISNRRALPPAVLQPGAEAPAGSPTAVANPARDGAGPGSDNSTVDGQPIPGFAVTGVIENGATRCPGTCEADTAASPHTIAGHTASDVPLSAGGPGAYQFTGTYDNTDVMLKMLRSSAGSYPARGDR